MSWARRGAIVLEIALDLAIGAVLVNAAVSSFSIEGISRFVVLGASALFALVVVSLASARRPFVTSSFGAAIIAALTLGLAFTHEPGSLPIGPARIDVHRAVAPLLAFELALGVIVVGIGARRALRRLPRVVNALTAAPFLAAIGWFVSRAFVNDPARLFSNVDSLPRLAQPGFVATIVLLPVLALAVVIGAIVRRAHLARDFGIALTLLAPTAFGLAVHHASHAAPCWCPHAIVSPTPAPTPIPAPAPVPVREPAPVVATPEPPRVENTKRLVAPAPVARFDATVTLPADLRGFDVAAPSLGGRIVRVSSSGASARVVPEHLLGGAFDPRWVVESSSLPQSVLVGFRETAIDRVVLDTRWYDFGEDFAFDESCRVREVEILADGASLGIFGIAEHGRFVTLQFTPVIASGLEVRILSARGGAHTGVRTVHVFEAETGRAFVGSELDLAKLDLGGEIVRFTSQDPSNEAWHLVDGSARGWTSGSSAFPQSFVFSVPNESAALVSAIELAPATDRADDERPREVRILASTASPIDGFREVAHATLGREGPWRVSLEPAVAARWLEIRIDSNHGGARTSVGELRVIEARESGYRSVLAGGGLVLPDGSLHADAAIVVSADLVEREPNDSIAAANPLSLEKTIQGRIEPRGEQDVFAIDVRDDARGKVLDLALEQSPLRSSVTLLDADGKALATIDPSETDGARGDVTWLATDRRYYARVTEPRSSIVLVWDLSGSMRPATATLENVLRSWVARVEPSEEVALVSFQGRSVDVRRGFTSDREKLTRALDGAFEANGGTPFYDALRRAVEMLKDRKGNRAIVLMTDGGDTTSSLSPTELWETLERERIHTTTVSLGPELGLLVSKQGCDGARFLSSIARAIGGLAFHAEEAAELASIYDGVARELRRSTPYRLRVEPARAGKLAIDDRRDPSERWGGPRRIEFILDGSASMDEPVGGFRREVSEQNGATSARLVPTGPRKIQAAREALDDMLATLPDTTEVALRSYGFTSRRAGDTRLLVPFAALDRARLSRIAHGIVPAGNTPIAASLARVPDDFGGRGGVVVLISDGKETCGGDPAAEARRLVRDGFDVKVHVVGFDLRGEEANAVEQLRAIATATGGRFFQADDRDALRTALLNLARTGWHLEDATGAVVARGVLSDATPADVPSGTYKLVIERTPALAFERVTVRPAKTTCFVLSGAGARVRGGIAEEAKQ